MYMVYSVAQAAAAAEAGASIVNANCGRTRVFHTKNPGLIRDPHVGGGFRMVGFQGAAWSVMDASACRLHDSGATAVHMDLLWVWP